MIGNNSEEQNRSDIPLVWQRKEDYQNWLMSVIYSSIILSLSLYMTIMLFIELCKFKRKNRLENTIAVKYGLYMRITSVILGVTVMMNCPLIENILVEIFFPSLCGIVRRFRGTGGSFTLMFSYGVMWFRQRSIYSDRAMKHLTTPITRTLSTLVGILVIILPTAIWLIYIISLKFKVIHFGCAIVYSYIPPRIMWIGIGLSSMLLQSIMLGLFLLPLHKHRSNMLNLTNSPSVGKHLLPIIRRAFITALVCAISDTTSSFMSSSAVLKNGMVIPITMLTSSFINLLMVVMSFPEWKRTMFPYCVNAIRKMGEANTQEKDEIGDQENTASSKLW